MAKNRGKRGLFKQNALDRFQVKLNYRETMRRWKINLCPLTVAWFVTRLMAFNFTLILNEFAYLNNR
jgi:hypothetical protein